MTTGLNQNQTATFFVNSTEKTSLQKTKKSEKVVKEDYEEALSDEKVEAEALRRCASLVHFMRDYLLDILAQRCRVLVLFTLMQISCTVSYDQEVATSFFKFEFRQIHDNSIAIHQRRLPPVKHHPPSLNSVHSRLFID